MSNIGDVPSTPRAKKEFNLNVNLISVNNFKRKDESWSLGTLYCECLADGNVVGRCENTDIPKGSSVNITVGHAFSCVVSERSKVAIAVHSNHLGPASLLGQGVVSISELEVGKQDFRFLSLKKKSKKDIVGGEVQVMLNLSKKVSVSGPTVVTKPGKDAYLEEDKNPNRGVVTGERVSKTDSAAKLASEDKKKNYQRSQSSGGLVKKKTFSSKFRGKQTPKRGSQTSKKSSLNDKLLFQCIEYLSHPECLGSAGIFRVSASHGEIRQLKEQHEEGHIIAWENREKYGEKNGVYVIAGLLIDLLLGMDEPLISFDAYEGLMQAEPVPDEEVKLRTFRSIINSVDPVYRSALAKVCHFLCAVAGIEGNKMTVNNLGIVFGPVLMRGRNETPQSIVDDSPGIIRIICSLIDNYEFFFLGARPVLGLYDGKSQTMQDNPSSTPQKKGEKKEEEKEKIEIGEEYVEERGLQRYLFAQLKGLEGLLGEVVASFEKGGAKEKEKWTTTLKKMVQIANEGPEKEVSAGGENEEGGVVGVMPVKGAKDKVEQLKGFCGSLVELLPVLIVPNNPQATKYGIQIGEVLRQLIQLVSGPLSWAPAALPTGQGLPSPTSSSRPNLCKISSSRVLKEVVESMQKEIKEGGEKVEGVSVGAVRDLMDGQTSKLREALKGTIQGLVKPFSTWFEMGITQQKEVNLMLLAAEYLDIASCSLTDLDKHELLQFDPQRLAGPLEIESASFSAPTSPVLEEGNSAKKLALNLPKHPSLSPHHPASSRLPHGLHNLPPPPQTDRPSQRPSHFSPLTNVPPPHNLPQPLAPPSPSPSPPHTPPASPSAFPPGPIPIPLPHTPTSSPRGNSLYSTNSSPRGKKVLGRGEERGPAPTPPTTFERNASFGGMGRGPAPLPPNPRTLLMERNASFGGSKGPAPPPPPPPLPPPSASDDIMLLKGTTFARLDKIRTELKKIQGSCCSVRRTVLVDQAGVVSALLSSFEKLKAFWETRQTEMNK